MTLWPPGTVRTLTGCSSPPIITFQSSFQAGARDSDGNLLPTPLALSHETVGQQKVVVRDVSGPDDLNFIDAAGDLVWVLANNPNANHIAEVRRLTPEVVAQIAYSGPGAAGS